MFICLKLIWIILKNKKTQTINCSIEENDLALLAYTRANTHECKTLIHSIACQSIQLERSLEQNNTSPSHQQLYDASTLASRCNQANNEHVNADSNIETRLKSKFLMGCAEPELFFKFLSVTTSRGTFKNVSSLQLCIRICLSVFDTYAAYEHRKRNCICLDELKSKRSDLRSMQQIKKKLIGNCLHFTSTQSNIYEIHRTGYIGNL